MDKLDTNYVDVSLDELVNDINIKVIDQKDEIDGYETSFCKLSVYGKQINHIIINTLRRVILSLIPVYSFDAENINITKNTSVFNNDMMRLRLSNFPVYLSKQLNKKYKDLKKINHNQIINPDNTLSHAKELEYRANLGSAEIDVTLEDSNKQDITNNLTITVNVKNNSENEIMNVMTNTPGVKYYLDKEQISHIYSNPLLIIQLQPGQEFICTMISSLNIPLYNAIFRPCTLCHFEKINENNYHLSVASRRQISEKDIIIRACKIIKEKIKSTEQVLTDNIKSYINDNEDDENISTEHLRKGTIVIEGEQHTIGNLFSRFLQDHKNITFAGYRVGHPNVNQVDIEYVCNTSILTVIKEVCISMTKLFDQIESKVNVTGSFGYDYI
jgi:DNA-directed RNA polymerase subunit L